MNKKGQVVGALMLLTAALFWGMTCVAQDIAAVHVEGFTFQSVRSLIGALALLPVILARDAYAKKQGTYRPLSKKDLKYLLPGGVLCGAILCTATVLQQFGIAQNVTSPGKDAFITALYIVFVPVFGAFFGKRAKPHVYLSVAVALFGLWLLCMGGDSLSRGDLLVMLCSLAFSCHILVVDTFAPHVDGVRLSCLQFLVVGVIAGVFMLIVERPHLSDILAAAGPILFAAIFSSAGAYTLQILGQQRTPSTVASLVMSLESVFAVIASALILPDIPPFSLREWGGMILIFGAVIFSQIPLNYAKLAHRKQAK